MKTPLIASVAAAVLASQAPSGGAEPLRFCLAAHNLPFSTSHSPWGIDGEIAQRLGEELNRSVEFVWIQETEESPEAALREGRCDAATGAIVEADGLAQASSVPDLRLTAPYYTAGYLLIQRPDAATPAGLDQVGEERIAVEMDSIPIYTLKQRGKRVHAVDDTEAVISSVAEGRARYGYAWGPVAAWLLRERSDVTVSPSFEPEEVWSFSLATRSRDERLHRSLSAALAQLVEEGVVARAFATYGVPYIPPQPPTGHEVQAER